MAIICSPDVDNPIYRDQSRCGGESQHNLWFTQLRKGVAQLLVEEEDYETESQSPHCAMGNDLIGTRWLKQWPVEREEPPQNIGT